LVKVAAMSVKFKHRNKILPVVNVAK